MNTADLSHIKLPSAGLSLESYRAPSYDELRQNKLYLNGMSPKFRPKSQSETGNKTQKMGKIANYNYSDKQVQGRLYLENVCYHTVQKFCIPNCYLKT